MGRVVSTLRIVGLVAGFAGAAAAQPRSAESLLSEMRWRCIGPFRGGRTVGASGVPGQTNVFYIGVNNGGVWKTNDYGRVWRPVFDGQPTQSIGTVTVAPSDPNVVYAGSGEGLQRPDLSVGDGVYKSTDAGGTWRHMGLRDAQQIAAIAVDPRDARRVLVAALGHPYGPNAERGVFRSTDGGETWRKTLGNDENTGAVALALDAANPDVVYGALWEARQAPWENGHFGGPGSGLHKSTDGGVTWKPLGKGLPTFDQGLSRIGIGLSPSDPKRIYALVEAKPEHGGLYRSDDAGESFERVNSETRIWGRGDDFAEVKVHPKNRDAVFVANTSTYRSSDGGKTFTAFKGAPGGDDYHGIWVSPDNPDVMLLASDQGATITVNGGETWSSWYNQPTAQLYHVSTDDRFPYWVYGGQQESGSVAIVSRGDHGAISFRDWHPVGAEEYGYVAADPKDPEIVYGGKLSRFDTRTGDTEDVSPEPVPTGKYRFLRTAPVLFSPTDPNVLYYAGNVLFKTTNGGSTWEVLSPDLSRESTDVPACVGVYRTPALEKEMKETRRGVIYTVAPSAKDGRVIWAGTDDGLIHVTRDGGTTWADVTPKELTPWSKVSLIEASRFDVQTAYAAVNRFRLDDLRPHIYRTHDGGKTWTEIVKGLADAPVNAVREDPVRKGLLFAATERGVAVSFDDGDSWQPLSLNLPPSSARDIVVHGDDLVVATHGRSFWILDDITPLRQLTAEVEAADVHLFAPQTAVRVRRDKNTDTPLPPEEPVGQNPPDGAIFHYALRSPGAGPVTLEILDGAGTLVRKYSSADRPEPPEEGLSIPDYWIRPPRVLAAGSGLHRFVWDLRYPPPDALERGYPISAIYRDTPKEPLGPFVVPGTYTVRLSAGGKTLIQPLTVTMDPRVKTPPEGLKRQLDLAMRIGDALRRDAEALKRVQALRAQLEERRGRVKKGKRLDAIAALDRKAAALESGAAGGRRRRAPAGEPDLTRLNGDLVTLLGVVEAADVAPTARASAALGELEKELARLVARWDELVRKELPAANKELHRAGLPAVTSGP